MATLVSISAMREFRREAAKHGATISDDGGPRNWAWSIDLPSGRVWKATGGHCLLATSAKGRQSWKVDVVEEAVERMAMGTMECDDPDCDVCHPEATP